MAERIEEPEAATEQALDQASPAAVALALGRTSKGAKPLDAKAAAFLEKQTRLIDLQTEHLHEQRELQTSRLRLGRWKDRVSLGLQAMTALVGMAAIAAVAVMAWQAHQDHGLTIEAFSVPPDLAQRGLTGQVVAARVLDRLSELQAETVSNRPASTYAKDWGEDIKVEIPETGVSLGELNRYLREWLSDETRVSGDVVHTATGLSVTARTGDQPGKAVQGSEGDVDGLISQAGEALYASTQAYRYAVYLASHGKPDEALAAFIKLARTGSTEDRRWAYTGWSLLAGQRGGARATVAVVREGEQQGLSLHDTGGDAYLTTALHVLAQYQISLKELRAGLERDRSSKLRTEYVGPQARRVQESFIAGLLGDEQSAAAGIGVLGETTSEGGGEETSLLAIAAQARVRDHDVSGGRRQGDAIVFPPGLARPDVDRGDVDREAAKALDDWAGVVALAEPQQAGDQTAGPLYKDHLERSVWPDLAVAYARLGRQAEAEALVAKTPLDCDPCMEARALVAAAKRDWAGADRWFAAIDRQAPDIPFWDADWGRTLLDRGDMDGAVAKLSQAHRKGPHHADPQELWGEALLAKGDFKGAAAKFRAADKDAPRWGRNHLRWGQALARLGRADEANAQWQAAAGMDLSDADRAELARVRRPAPKRTS